MIRRLSVLLAAACLSSAQAEDYPSFAETIPLGHSIVMVSTDLPNSVTGRGSGVVVSKEYVATNCHVLANARGTSIAKFRNAYTPKALKANWRRDLCLLKFDELPLTPISMRDSSSLAYEEKVFSLSFPAGANVPQPSYGTVKALYPFENSQIIRTDASFTLGSSGGALFDLDHNLIGITTFKSPGKHNGYFYSLPVEWVKELMASPDVMSLKTSESPFWALPLNERPFFMQVVLPYQHKEWANLKQIAEQWVNAEPDSADAFYFLGLAQEGLDNVADAKTSFDQALALNSRDLDVMMAISRIAFADHDLAKLESLQAPVTAINSNAGATIAKQIATLK